MSMENPRVAILASGDIESGKGGSTADRFTRDSLKGIVSFDVGLVICNNVLGSVGVYPRFEQINSDFGLYGEDRIEVINISSKTCPKGPQERGQTLEESAAICDVLEDYEIDFVAMLGYMKKLNGKFVDEWAWKPQYAEDTKYGYREGLYHPNARISNNHPAILPFSVDTHGSGAHGFALGIGVTAMTWHLASSEIDKGPVIAEEPVKVEPEDTIESLSDRVQDVEKALTSLIIEKHLKMRAAHQHVNS